MDKIKGRFNLSLKDSSSTVDELLDTIATNVVLNVSTDLLKSISVDYKLNIVELKEKYLADFLPNKFYNLLINKLLGISRDTHLKLTDVSSNNLLIEDLDKSKCLARVQHGKQCTRNKKNAEFCGSHISNLPYGRIDEPQDLSDSIKKRGRPKTLLKKKDNIEKDYEIIEYEGGKDYLVNVVNGKVYNIPENDDEVDIDSLVHIGFKIGDKIEFL